MPALEGAGQELLLPHRLYELDGGCELCYS
jgi:hypothetical protein